MMIKIKHRPSIVSDHPIILAVSDAHPGNARQAEALAETLAPNQTRHFHVLPRIPWRWLSPRRLPGSRHAFGATFTELLDHPPALAIGCGRQAALATRLLRAAGSQVVQILNPRLSCRHWDILIVPAHDGVSGRNVLKMAGSLHPVDDAWLAAARSEFAWLERLPAPRLTVLVGGDSRHGRLPAHSGDLLLGLAEHWHRITGGCILATTSRRTPTALAERLAKHLRQYPGLCWTGPADGVNPFPGLLAFADCIVCTADSVNLLSEACATRVPVHVIAARENHGGPHRFVQGLCASGRIQRVDCVETLIRPATVIVPLRETARIAALVRDHLG